MSRACRRGTRWERSAWQPLELVRVHLLCGVGAVDLNSRVMLYNLSFISRIVILNAEDDFR